LPALLAGDLKHVVTELIYTVYIERGIRIVSIKVKTLEIVIKNKKSVKKAS